MTAEAPAPYRGARVVVLGAGGFIGGWVARLLLAGGADVRLVARDTAAPALSRLVRSGAGAALAADLARPDAARALIAATRPAVVFNLAGYGVDPSEREETAAERLNTDLPAALAEAMAKHGDAEWRGQQVVHVGSALEYGTASGDLRETTEGTPTTLYGRTKLAGTRRLHAMAAHAGVRAVTGRLFMIYGPGEHPGRLLPTLVAAAASAGPIALTSGLQRRDFTYVAEAAEGLLRLGALTDPALGAVNVATGRQTSVREFVEITARVLGIAPERLGFGAVATRAEEQQHDPVNIERLRTLTGWSPALTVEEGVRQTVAFGAAGAA